MDSEAFLADHQTTDGIVEEKKTVKEKSLSGEESKDEENAAIAEAEKSHADRVAPESVIYCSKMPSSTSEKDCRKEEAIKEVDSFSEVVEVSPTEEATNKTIEMIKDNKNELQVPSETASPAEEVAAANGEVEDPPVESNIANSAAGAAEEISERVVEQGNEVTLVIPTESSSIASATSDVAIAEERREIEAKLEDEKEVGREVERQVPTDSVELVADEVEKQVSITLVVDSSSTEIAEESREVEAEVEPQASSNSSIATSDVEKQVLNESSTAASATSFTEEARETEAEIEEDEKKEAMEIEELDPSNSTTGDNVVAEETEKVISELGNDHQKVLTAEEEEQIQPEETEDVNTEKTGEVEAKFADDNQEEIGEVEKEVETETDDGTSSVLTADEIGNTKEKIVEDEKEAAKEVQEQALSGSSTSTLTNLIDDEQEVAEDAEKKVPSNESTEVEAKIDDGKTEVEQQFPSDSTNAIEIAEQSGEIGHERSDDKQEVTTEAEKHVATETSDVASIVVTADEVGSTEVRIMEDEKEAETEVQEQIPSGCSTSTQKLEPKFVDEEEVTRAEAGKQIPIEESTEIGAKVEDGKKEVEIEVEQHFPTDSGGTTPIGITENSQEIEDELADDYQEVITEAEKQVASETSNATLAFVTADEVGKTEAKIENEKEAATEVQEQVQTDSDTFTSANRIAQETRRLESKLTDDDQEVLKEAKKQISSEESSDVGVKIDDGKTEVEPGVEQQFPSDSGSPTSATVVAERTGEIEAGYANDNKEVKKEAEKQVATETNGVTSAVAAADEVRNTEAKIDDDEKEDPTEVREQVASVSSISTSVDKIVAETKKLEPELIDEDQAAPTETEKQIPVEESTEIGARVEDGYTELQSEVQQQFPSDFSRQTSAIGITEKSREIEAELADVYGEVLGKVEKPIATEPNDSTLAISTSEEFRETKAKIESDEEGAGTEVGEQISSDSSTSANRTDEVKLVDDNQEAVANAEEQLLIESSRDISVVAGVEGNKEIDAELKDNKQQEAAEVREQELNPGNEADAANDNGRILAGEETENATIDGTSNNSNVTELKTINLEQEDAGTNHTSVVQTAGEISQPEVEVENEKQDALTQIEEPSVVELNKIDSGSLAELPAREQKPHASTESVEKKDNILEDKTSMDNLKDVNTISQVPRSNVEEAKGPINDEKVRKINDNSQTDAKDMDIEISKEDKITLVESSNNLDYGTETKDEFEGKKSSEGIEIAEGENEDEDSKHSYAPDVTESSDKMEKSEVAKEKCEGSENNSIITDETTKSAGENADASSNLSVENKTSEDKEEKESKDENVNRDYVEAPKDIDVKEEIATAVSAFVDAENKKESEKTIDESLSPKSADLVKLEEVPKESAPAKSSPRRSNNIISKVKNQIVKAKKAIMGKSPSSKDMSPKSKEEFK